MAESGQRFQRFVIELEVQVDDPVAVRAATLRTVETEDGESVPFDPEGRGSVRHAVSHLVTRAIGEDGAPFGIGLVGAIVTDRLATDGVFPEVTVPERPARPEDDPRL